MLSMKKVTHYGNNIDIEDGKLIDDDLKITNFKDMFDYYVKNCPFFSEEICYALAQHHFPNDNTIPAIESLSKNQKRRLRRKNNKQQESKIDEEKKE